MLSTNASLKKEVLMLNERGTPSKPRFINGNSMMGEEQKTFKADSYEDHVASGQKDTLSALSPVVGVSVILTD